MSETPETIYERYERLSRELSIKDEQLPALVSAEYIAERLTVESDKIIAALRSPSRR